jgi:regulator of replication initiation timing
METQLLRDERSALGNRAFPIKSLFTSFKKDGFSGFPRLRLWEIAIFFRCPVMGLCLRFSEQKRLLKKVGYAGERKNGYEIHEMLVACCNSENRLSCKVEQLLNRKYKDDIRQIVGLDEDAFMRYWRTGFENGEWTSALWIAAIHPCLSLSARLAIFGDIHMAMHDNAGQICQLKQQLTSWRNEYDQISQRSRQVLKEKKQLRKENDALQATCDEYRAEHSRLVEEKQRLISGSNSLENGSAARLKDENRRLLEDLENLTEEKKVLGRQRGELQREKERLAEQLEQQITINAQLQSDMQAMNRWAGELQKLKEWTHQKCNVNCPSFDLCQKRVLIVGGITRMEAAYRRLIESRGGIFDYHDGYMKKGVKKLYGAVSRQLQQPWGLSGSKKARQKT